jgi:type IV pilus assembly protein PilO
MALELGLQDKPWYYGLIIGLLLAGGLLYATHAFLVSPINEQIAAATSELDELGRKIEAGRAAEKSLPQFREEVKRLELELEKLRRILPSSRNTEEIIKKLKALVDQGDFVLRRMSFPPLAPSAEGEVYAEWPISVQLEGGYHNLALLFNRLSNFSRIVNVEQFNITGIANQEQRTISSDFVAKTFVYIEPKDGAADTAGTPGGTP